MKILRDILLPIGIGLGILALLGALGSAIFLYREATAIHPALGWVVVALLAAGIYLLVLAPTLRILALPRALVRPAPDDPVAWNRYVQRYADRMLTNPHLADWSGLADLRTARAAQDPQVLETRLGAAVAELDRRAN